MRWYSPFDWIPGPETEEEIEELKRLRGERDRRNEESTATAVTGRKIEDLCNVLNLIRNNKVNCLPRFDSRA